MRKCPCITDTQASDSCLIFLFSGTPNLIPFYRRTSLNFLTAFLAVAIAALAVGLRTSTSGGYLGVALSQLVGLSQTLINLLLAYTRVENGLVSIERIFELDRLESEGGDESLTKAPSPEWPSQGAIEFRNVNLRYGLVNNSN